MAFATGLLVGDARRAFSYESMESSRLYKETLSALSVSSAGTVHILPGNFEQRITCDDLAATGKLSALTQAWLRGCSIIIYNHPEKINDLECVRVEIDLANSNDVVFFLVPTKKVPSSAP